MRFCGGPVCIPEAVKREALYLAPSLVDEPRLRIDMDAVVSELKLEIVGPSTTEEVELYVHLASDLDDGEAMGLALAKTRRLVLLTDERKARRRAAALGVEVLTTPDIVHAWAQHHSESRIADVIKRISRFARYVPSAKETHYHWWMNWLSTEVAIQTAEPVNKSHQEPSLGEPSPGSSEHGKSDKKSG